MVQYISKDNSYTALSTDTLTELLNSLSSSISHGIKLYMTDTYETKMYDQGAKKFIDYYGSGSGSSSGTSVNWGSTQW